MFRLAEICEKDFPDLDIEDAAADKGDVEAQYHLGCLYADERFNGRAGLRNDSAAVEWLTLAAENGHPQAQAALGLMHAAGRTGMDAREASIRAGMWCSSAANGAMEQRVRIADPDSGEWQQVRRIDRKLSLTADRCGAPCDSRDDTHLQ